MSLNRTFDRCDHSGVSIDKYENHIRVSCQAQAFVKLTKTLLLLDDDLNETADFGETDLLLCGHHFTKHEFALIEQGFVVDTDARADLLDENRLVGSEN